MTTSYVYRLTVAVPESLIEAANHLAVAIGESAGDFYTFEQADWQDIAGNKYAVASMQATDVLFAYAGSQLQERSFLPPEWDFVKASQAQSVVQLWLGNDPEQPIPTANPSGIVGIVMDDAMRALNVMGLSRIDK